VHAVQASVPGAVKRASFAGMVNTFLKLVKDAAARHNTVMITPDITGWFFVISTHRCGATCYQHSCNASTRQGSCTPML
jgi:hypothetical protein